MAKRSPLPETQNQWKIPIEQIDPYLKWKNQIGFCSLERKLDYES
jgi:hypothetical protein